MLGLILTGQFGFAAELTTALPTMYVVAVVAAAIALTMTFDVRTTVVAANSPVGVPSAVRRFAARTVFLPLRDPGAAGRPRPRAPSH